MERDGLRRLTQLAPPLLLCVGSVATAQAVAAQQGVLTIAPPRLTVVGEHGAYGEDSISVSWSGFPVDLEVEGGENVTASASAPRLAGVPVSVKVKVDARRLAVGAHDSHVVVTLLRTGRDTVVSDTVPVEIEVRFPDPRFGARVSLPISGPAGVGLFAAIDRGKWGIEIAGGYPETGAAMNGLDRGVALWGTTTWWQRVHVGFDAALGRRTVWLEEEVADAELSLALAYDEFELGAFGTLPIEPGVELTGRLGVYFRELHGCRLKVEVEPVTGDAEGEYEIACDDEALDGAFDGVRRHTVGSSIGVGLVWNGLHVTTRICTPIGQAIATRHGHTSRACGRTPRLGFGVDLPWGGSVSTPEQTPNR